MPLNKLHYGGSINKSGRLGPKPGAGATFKKTKRFEDITRLELAGFSESAIASMLCMSVNRLRHIKKQPDYLMTRVRLTHGIILDNDAKIQEIKEQRKEMMVQMLPAALQAVGRILQKDAASLSFQEQRLQVAVAQDVMDRTDIYAKISRTEVKPVGAFDFERSDTASHDIIAAIRGVASPTGDSGMVSTGTLEKNKEFSNSKTISAIDQQTALDDLEAALPELPTANDLVN